MQKRKIKRLDQSATNGRESGRTTAKNGRKGYLSKSGKASSQPRRRQGNERASGGKKQRKDSHLSAFKLADFLTAEEIKRLKAIKEEIENGRTNLKRSTSRK